MCVGNTVALCTSAFALHLSKRLYSCDFMVMQSIGSLIAVKKAMLSGDEKALHTLLSPTSPPHVPHMHLSPAT